MDKVIFDLLPQAEQDCQRRIESVTAGLRVELAEARALSSKNHDAALGFQERAMRAESREESQSDLANMYFTELTESRRQLEIARKAIEEVIRISILKPNNFTGIIKVCNRALAALADPAPAQPCKTCDNERYITGHFTGDPDKD